MKLVTFETGSPFGSVRRIGGVLGAGEMNDNSQIVDLNTAYGLQLREQGDNRWAQIADAALPPDMLEFLEGGTQAMDRARGALSFAGTYRGDAAGRQLVFARNAVKLLSPLPRPTSMRDFS